MDREERFILARYTYRVGAPIIDDHEYDELEREFMREGILLDYIGRSYDDDPIPYELLKRYDMEYLIVDTVDKMNITNSQYPSKYMSYVDSTKSLSIRPVIDMREVFEFARANKGNDFNMSLKMDGVNSKTLYVDGKFELCISRGRKGNGIDYTKCASKVMPSEIKTDAHIMIVYTEAFVLEQNLPYLREKYGKPYKTPKAAAITMLRVEHDPEDYKLLHMVAIDVEGLDVRTKEEKYQALTRAGFYIPVYTEIKDVPSTFNEFNKYMLDLCDEFYNVTKILPSDGLVLEVNDLERDYRVNNQYCDRNIALKISHWSFTKYKAIVEDIVFEQQRVNVSCRRKIKTVVTDDSCEATWVNCYNPDILISNNINIGSEIYFERNSGAINSLVYKED